MSYFQLHASEPKPENPEQFVLSHLTEPTNIGQQYDEIRLKINRLESESTEMKSKMSAMEVLFTNLLERMEEDHMDHTVTSMENNAPSCNGSCLDESAMIAACKMGDSESESLVESMPVDESMRLDESMPVDEAMRLDASMSGDEAEHSDQVIRLNELVFMRDSISLDESMPANDAVYSDQVIRVEDLVFLDEISEMDESVLLDESMRLDEASRLNHAIPLDELVILDGKTQFDESMRLDESGIDDSFFSPLSVQMSGEANVNMDISMQCMDKIDGGKSKTREVIVIPDSSDSDDDSKISSEINDIHSKLHSDGGNSMADDRVPLLAEDIDVNSDGQPQRQIHEEVLAGDQEPGAESKSCGKETVAVDQESLVENKSCGEEIHAGDQEPLIDKSSFRKETIAVDQEPSVENKSCGEEIIAVDQGPLKEKKSCGEEILAGDQEPLMDNNNCGEGIVAGDQEPLVKNTNCDEKILTGDQQPLVDNKGCEDINEGEMLDTAEKLECVENQCELVVDSNSDDQETIVSEQNSIVPVPKPPSPVRPCFLKSLNDDMETQFLLSMS